MDVDLVMTTSEHGTNPQGPCCTPTLAAVSHSGRPLPSRDVTRDSINQGFVHFILFCNPAYDANQDYASLEDALCSPPTCNKQTFHLYDVFVQVRRLHTQEIKTWHQLALDLGVKAGVADDNKSSSQLVPQYAVRLRRWLKHVHADAYFDHLLGKAHEYYTRVPPLSDPHPADGRDGVASSDDLALRALNPGFRPKRGRKRLQESMEDLPPERQHSLSAIAIEHRPPLSATPASAFPRSAFPQSAVSAPFGKDPWSSVVDSNKSASKKKTDNFRHFSPATPGAPSSALSSQNTLPPLGAHDSAKNQQRGQRLQLTVPQATTAPVRLMTPLQPSVDKDSTLGEVTPRKTPMDVSPRTNVSGTAEVDWRSRCEELQQENRLLRSKLAKAKAQLNEIMESL